jgi:lantibiotic modifying enzyme
MPDILSDHRATVPGPWRVLMDQHLREASTQLVLDIAGRLRDPRALAIEVERARARTPGLLWRAPSLASGYTGIALFYRYLAEAMPRGGWENVAHQYIRLAAKHTHTDPLRNAGLYSGSAGLGYALLSLSELDSRYRLPARRTYETIATQALGINISMATDSQLVNESEFDVISGAAGTLAVLLAMPQPSHNVESAIRRLISALTVLCAPTDHAERQNWLVPSRITASAKEGRVEYNVGLAHGVLGVAAVLSAAHKRGYETDGMIAAIDNVYSWFARQRIQGPVGVTWPHEVPAESGPSGGGMYDSRSTRCSWCYGTGGAARVLWQASGSLAVDMRKLALEAIESVIPYQPAELGLDGPSLCHGTAGMLMIYLRFANELHCENFDSAITLFTSALIAACDAEFPFYVQDPRPDGEYVDEPGFLTGAAGVGLALLAASTGLEPRWDRMMLLSS